MKIAKVIFKEFSDLNEAQRKAVGHAEGPLLIIAARIQGGRP